MERRQKERDDDFIHYSGAIIIAVQWHIAWLYTQTCRVCGNKKELSYILVYGPHPHFGVRKLKKENRKREMFHFLFLLMTDHCMGELVTGFPQVFSARWKGMSK